MSLVNNHNSGILASKFFMLRSPLLPIDDFLSWSADLQAFECWRTRQGGEALEREWNRDVALLRERLKRFLARPEIRHAIFVASPSLSAGLDKYWTRDPLSKKGLQAEHALVRYLARMSARSTPFGLFSGCSVGDLVPGNRETRLSLPPRTSYRLATRLDFDYLFALTDALRRDIGVSERLRYFPNSSLHRVANCWHYVESRPVGSRRTHHAVKIDDDGFLAALFETARSGASVAVLVQTLLACAADAEVSENEARAYVDDLILNGALVSSLSPLVTGDPLDDLVAQVDEIPSLGPIAETLRSVRRSLGSVDERGVGADPQEYEAISDKLRPLPARLDTARLYQIDMTKPLADGFLGAPVLDAITTAVEVLQRASSALEPESLKRFREAFVARYERRRVPLLDALDSEVGIGFGEPAAESFPLAQGVDPIRKDRRPGLSGGHLSEFQHFLLQRLSDRQPTEGGGIQLTMSDLPQTKADSWPLPTSFCVIAALASKSSHALQEGDFEVHLKGVVGPSGARFFGRFCHADDQLQHYVRQYMRQEEALDPNTVYAEVVHLPEGRIGNVLCRPVLRGYEIVYLGRSGAPLERQIPASDLFVSVEGQEVVLYSQTLGCRIIPRLTNAHGFGHQALSSVYRFLCTLQVQGLSTPYFSWGPLETLDYLPRLSVGRAVLSTARWRLTAAEVRSICDLEGSRRFAAMQELRIGRRLPRWIVLEEADNGLPIDLNNPLSVESLTQVLKRGVSSVVREMYPGVDETCVSGPEGRFCHELIVPFIRSSAALGRGEYRSVPTVPALPCARTLAPGGDWLYAKVYAGQLTMDEVLANVLPSILKICGPSGAVSRWFFVRFADPHTHLRLRFNGAPQRLLAEVLPTLIKAFNPLVDCGLVWKIQYDTYEREIERYGGPDGIRVSEDLFFADSDAIVQILQQLDTEERLDSSWRVALLGIDALVTDFESDLLAKRTLLSKLYPPGAIVGKETITAQYRELRSRIEALFADSSGTTRELDLVRDAFRQRSMRNMRHIAELRHLNENGALQVSLTSLIASYLHMHVNRTLRSGSKYNEASLCGLLLRFYDGCIARKRQASIAEINNTTRSV